MKKLALALMCAMGMLLIVSCSKKDSATPETTYPTIRFVNEEGLIHENTTINIGDSVRFKIECIATDSKDLLTNLSISLNLKNEVLGLDTTMKMDTVLNKLTTFTFDSGVTTDFIFPCVATLTGTVTTQNALTATTSLAITVEEDELEVNDLEWKRIGGQAQASGLEEFGLQWTSNYKDICASIKPVEGAFFFRFEGVDFADVTTETLKELVFLTGEQINEFHEISCEQATSTFDYVLGTVYNEEMYLIHLTNATVETAPMGTTVTITGQWK